MKGLLQVRRGPSPNCSSHGSVVGMALLGAAGAAVVLNVWADRFARWVRGGGGEEDAPDEQPVLREEDFGAVLAWPDGQLLLDHGAAQSARDAGGRQVPSGPSVSGALRAPIEAHVAVTGRCPVRCSGCYTGAGPEGGEVEGLRQSLEQLAGMGVLQVAFGGGEGLLVPELLELARHARRLGMVPNLTTSGFGLRAAQVPEIAEVFGQVNVSVDGLGEAYRGVRGFDGSATGLRAVERLLGAGARVGVNTVLARPIWEGRGLEELGRCLARLGVQEWQWLRLKPAGRGALVYQDMRCDLSELWPRVLAAEALGLRIRIDCALVPFLPDLPVERLHRLGVVGCPGGVSLMTRDAQGRWAPCSFVEGAPGEPSRLWRDDPQALAWRARAEDPPEPCASCSQRSVCRGGCRAVAGHLTGDPLAPDPECPRVRAWS